MKKEKRGGIRQRQCLRVGFLTSAPEPMWLLNTQPVSGLIVTCAESFRMTQLLQSDFSHLAPLNTWLVSFDFMPFKFTFQILLPFFFCLNVILLELCKSTSSLIFSGANLGTNFVWWIHCSKIIQRVTCCSHRYSTCFHEGPAEAEWVYKMIPFHNEDIL